MCFHVSSVHLPIWWKLDLPYSISSMVILPNFDWKSHKTTPLSLSLPYFLPISSFQKIEESFNLLSIYNFFYEMFFGNKWYHKFVSSFMATSFLVVRSSEGEKQENERQYVVWWTKTFKKVQPFSQEKLSSLLQLFLSCLNCLDKNLAGYCILNQGTFRYLFFAILSAVVRNVPSYILYSPVWYFFQNTLNLVINVGKLRPYSLVDKWRNFEWALFIQLNLFI